MEAKFQLILHRIFVTLISFSGEGAVSVDLAHGFLGAEKHPQRKCDLRNDELCSIVE